MDSGVESRSVGSPRLVSLVQKKQRVRWDVGPLTNRKTAPFPHE